MPSENLKSCDLAMKETAERDEVLKPKRRPQLKFRSDGICEAPGCGKPVPGGMVHINVVKYFCSKSCQRKEYVQRFQIGQCEYCGGTIKGLPHRSSVARFCCRACADQFKNEQMFAGTGPFRELIEEQIRTTSYAKSTNVKGSLTRFFTYVFTNEKIGTIDGVTPSVVTRFLADERKRGVSSCNSVTFVSSLFKRLMDEERFDKRNPVIPRMHLRTQTRRTRQPYDIGEMLGMWEIVEKSDDTQLKAMFSIGAESGLRNSEVCNIRLSDIDLVKQTIFVRMPTKNREERTVPFHNHTKKYVKQWLVERNPACGHDNLFHNTWLRPLEKSILDTWFRKLFRGTSAVASNFEFHRLRHTWATQLVNAGMQLPVLQKLGGWRSLQSVQIYAKILQSTVDRQYEEAYRVIEQGVLAEQSDESIPLMDLALMEGEQTTNGGTQVG